MESLTSDATAEAESRPYGNGTAGPPDTRQVGSASLSHPVGEPTERLTLYLRWPLPDGTAGRDGTASARSLAATQVPALGIRTVLAATSDIVSVQAGVPMAVPPAKPQRMPEQVLEFWSVRHLGRRLGDVVSSVLSTPLFKSGYGQ